MKRQKKFEKRMKDAMKKRPKRKRLRSKRGQVRV